MTLLVHLVGRSSDASCCRAALAAMVCPTAAWSTILAAFAAALVLLSSALLLLCVALSIQAHLSSSCCRLLCFHATGSFDVCGYCYAAVSLRVVTACCTRPQSRIRPHAQDDKRRIDKGKGSMDACGNCLLYSSPAFNKVRQPTFLSRFLLAALPLTLLVFDDADVLWLRRRAQQRQGRGRVRPLRRQEQSRGLQRFVVVGGPR